MKKKSEVEIPKNRKDVPVTAKMLFDVRAELIDKIGETKSELKSDIHGLRSEFHGLRSEFHGLRSDFDGLRSEFHGVNAKIDKISASTHRVEVLVEEQNARNTVVLDAIIGINERLEQVEEEQRDFRKIILTLAK